MVVEFSLIRNENDLYSIKDLYVNSFPPNERREFDKVKFQILKPENEIFKILLGDIVVGFISIWNFSDFVFIEHFAVKQELRGQGIGSDVINQITSKINKPFVLEVEPPTEEFSIKRVNFYKRLGFRLVDKLYMQPSYDGVKPEVELRLMLTADDYSDDWLNSCVRLIRSKVYGKL